MSSALVPALQETEGKDPFNRVDRERATAPLRGVVAAAKSGPILVITWTVTFVYLSTLIPMGWQRARLWDFSIYYASALALREGANPYRDDLQVIGDSVGLKTSDIHHAADTPTFLLCFEPLTRLKPETAYWTWFSVNFLCLLGALVMLLGPKSGLELRDALALAPFALLFSPLRVHFHYAQSQLLVLLIIVLMMRCLSNGRERAAGLLLAVAGLLRAYPLLIVLYLALRQRWQAVWWTVAGFMAGAVVTVAFLGIPRPLSFFGAIGVTTPGIFSLPPSLVFSPQNLSINGFFGRIFFLAERGAQRGAAVRLALTAIADLLVIGALVRATVLTRHNEDNDGRVLSLWIAAMILLSPVAWFHYLVLLFVPFAGIASAAKADRISGRALVAGIASYLLLESLGLTQFAMIRLGRVHPLGAALLTVTASAIFAGLVCAFISFYWSATDLTGTQPPRVVNTDAAAASG